jgi:hypothetical protein
MSQSLVDTDSPSAPLDEENNGSEDVTEHALDVNRPQLRPQERPLKRGPFLVGGGRDSEGDAQAPPQAS